MPKEDKDQKEAERLRIETLEKGRFAASVSDDNSVDTENEAYVGVDPEYRNHAYDTEAPSVSEDEEQGESERAAKQRELDAEEGASKVGHQGFTPDTPHPSEAVQPAAEAIEQNRAILAGQAAQASGSASATVDTSGADEGSSPFNG